tara:strand:- start:816 stop:1313 length:498 start_codon:yes stop_codon:yes gene_type:complete
MVEGDNESFYRTIVFLAGSIEMGVAEDWQTQVSNAILAKEGLDRVLVLNPRRDDWDSSWEQTIDNPNFKEQVEWELDGLEEAYCIPMYFDPDTKSPITLLEFGMFSDSGSLIVCCPKGFWRRGNIEIVCAREDIPLFDNKEEFIEATLADLKDWETQVEIQFKPK